MKQPVPCTLFRVRIDGKLFQPTDQGVVRFSLHRADASIELIRLHPGGEQEAYFKLAGDIQSQAVDRRSRLKLAPWTKHFADSEPNPQKKGGALYPLNGVINGSGPTDVLVCDTETCLFQQTAIDERGYRDGAGRELRPHIGDMRIHFEHILQPSHSYQHLRIVGDSGQRSVLDLAINGDKKDRFEHPAELSDRDVIEFDGYIRSMKPGDLLSLTLYPHRAGRDIAHQWHALVPKKDQEIVAQLESIPGLIAQSDLEYDMLWQRRHQWREVERDTFFGNLVLEPQPERPLNPKAAQQAFYHQERQAAKVTPLRRVMWGIGLLGIVLGLRLFYRSVQEARAELELMTEDIKQSPRTSRMMFIGVTIAALLILFILDWTITPAIVDTGAFS